MNPFKTRLTKEFKHADLYSAVGPKPKEEKKVLRTCLKCGGKFLSMHKFNRLCEECKKRVDYNIYDASSYKSVHRINVSELDFV